MTNSGRMGIGVIGSGMISDQYLAYLGRYPDVKVLVVGDIFPERAAAQADKFGIHTAGTAETVLEHSGVELVVNLTTPAAHVPVSIAALEAGKHVWSEKPIGVNRKEAMRLLEVARSRQLRVGIAPDTIFGPGFQAVRKAIAQGDIGKPVSAITMMQHAGPEAFHPAPEFLYAPGGGPLYDMGPYYLSALVNIFGPVARVQAIGSKARTTRTIAVGERAGQTFPVEVFTNVAALLEFSEGGVSQSIFSFDSPIFRNGFVEITGTEASIVVPDPNNFTGAVRLTRGATFSEDFTITQEWTDVDVERIDVGRGLGVLDMARAIRGGKPHIASGELGYHVLDTIISIDEAMSSGQSVAVDSHIDPIPSVPSSYDPFSATL